MSARRSIRRRGFTMIEAGLTTIIVGVGIAASMSLFGACSMQNINASQSTTAMMLADNIQEAMANLSFADPITGTTTFGPEGGETLASYDDVDDFDGLTISPPIDATRASLTDLSQYSQVIAVTPVDPNNLTTTLAKTTTTRTAVRVQVRVLFKQTPTSSAQELYRTDWVKTSR
jgi:MSHA pilin protein MshD